MVRRYSINRYRYNGLCAKNISEYRSWYGAVNRCTSPADQNWKHYGGRGIRVYERWLHSFENFLTDMGKKPTPKHTLDRIDNDGDYEPSNCQWATRKEQADNTRRTKKVTYQGRTLCIMDWSRETGLEWVVIFSRLKRGWTVKDALTTRTADGHKRRRMILTCRGQTRDSVEWSKLSGVATGTILYRIRTGWDVEDAIFTKPGEEGVYRITFNGESLSLSEWSRKTGIPMIRISQRIAAGWDARRVLTTPVRR